MEVVVTDRFHCIQIALGNAIAWNPKDLELFSIYDLVKSQLLRDDDTYVHNVIVWKHAQS